MVAKTKTKASQKKNKVKIGKLKLNKETVKELTGGQKKQLRGGAARQNKTDDTCLVIACSVGCI